jgi:hypothetical protein
LERVLQNPTSCHPNTQDTHTRFVEKGRVNGRDDEHGDDGSAIVRFFVVVDAAAVLAAAAAGRWRSSMSGRAKGGGSLSVQNHGPIGSEWMDGWMGRWVGGFDDTL